MHIIQLKIHKFLQDIQAKPYSIPEALLSKFGEETKYALKRQFERAPRDFKPSMSSVGKPICQLQYEQQGLRDSFNIIRNLYGDIAEDIVLFLLHASGITVVSELQRVSLVYDNVQINGEYDVILDLGDGPKVWDIKSASEWAFKNKFTDVNFEEFVRDDHFGYVIQLILYSEALGMPAGGWIVFDKSSGEIGIVEFPTEQSGIRQSSIETAKRHLKILSNQDDQKKEPAKSGKSVKRAFKATAEKFRKKPTGNWILQLPCTMCHAKWKCWPSLVIKPQEQSTSQTPKLMFYVDNEH